MALQASFIISMRLPAMYAAIPTPTVVDFYISQAREQTSDTLFGDDMEKAVALRAMHRWSLDQLANGSASGNGMQMLNGQASSMREGQLSISNSGPSSIALGYDVDLGMTVYGQELLALIRSKSLLVSNRMM